MTDEWLHLPDLHDRYLHVLDKLGMFQLTGIDASERKQAEAECWKIRTDAFRILVKARDAGHEENSLDAEAGAFSWSVDQLDNEALREWLLALRGILWYRFN